MTDGQAGYVALSPELLAEYRRLRTLLAGSEPARDAARMVLRLVEHTPDGGLTLRRQLLQERSQDSGRLRELVDQVLAPGPALPRLDAVSRLRLELDYLAGWLQRAERAAKGGGP